MKKFLLIILLCYSTHMIAANNIDVSNGYFSRVEPGDTRFLLLTNVACTIQVTQVGKKPFTYTIQPEQQGSLDVSDDAVKLSETLYHPEGFTIRNRSNNRIVTISYH